MTSVPSIDVVVPSFARPDALARCLDAVVGQEVRPSRVIVVARTDDAATREVVARYRAAGVTGALVDDPGLVPALRRGVAATAGDVIAWTDDDARPRADWIARIAAWFARADVGAVGGRDVQEGVPGDFRKVVGRMAPFGRLTGWHDVGSGSPTDVDVLKGVNLAVRAEAMVLPRPGVLCEAGHAMHVEVLICHAVRRAGWRVVYDPAIKVDHDVLPRPDSLRIHEAADRALVRAVATNRITAATVLDRRRLPVQLGYGLLVGTRESPGLARAAVAIAQGEREVASRLVPSLVGQVTGAWRAARDHDAVDTGPDLRGAR